MSKAVEEGRQRALILRIQRERQQGKGRPIISTVQGETRFVAVGNKLAYGRWRVFADFLVPHLSQTLGSEWGNAEIAKPHEERHPIVRWYQALAHLQQEHHKPGEISAMPLLGVARAYLWLAYDLYTLEHNSASMPKPEIWERLLDRLRHPDQFVGARYELRVAAIFVRAGFKLDWEDETDNSGTHGEFTATFPATGRKFWVECKMRQPDPAKDPAENVGKFRSLVVKALRKKTDMERIVFVELNMPVDGQPDRDNPGWRDWAVGCLRVLEGSAEGKALPPALILITNYPEHHHLDTLVPDLGAVLDGFNMEDHRLGVPLPLREAIERREREPELNALFASMTEHTEIPTTFDAEIPELLGVQARLRIGERFEIEPGKVGTLVEACLMEKERQAACVLQHDDGTQAIYQLPLTIEEVTAWLRYPETFLGVLRQPNKQVSSPLELYDWFLASMTETPKEILIERLGGGDQLAGLSQTDLAKELAIRLTEGHIQHNTPFATPKWAERLRPPGTAKRNNDNT